jgi:transposase-like protein
MEQELKDYLKAERHQRKKERVSYPNGYYQRDLDTELGVIKEISVPRSRDGKFKTKVFKSYQRQKQPINNSIKEMFIQGVSPRQIGNILEPFLGKRICSVQSVSNIVKELDSEVERFHQRPLEDKYTYLFWEGIYLSKKKAIGAKKKPVLVAYGITKKGKRELIDYRQANSESEGAWFFLLDYLYHRGLRGNSLKLILTDGCSGLLAALDLVYPIQIDNDAGPTR